MKQLNGQANTPINEIILYQPDNAVKLEVRLENETVWLSQAQMVELFQTTKPNISIHISNVFKEGELERNSVVKESLTTATDGKKYRVDYYNLDVIISVGYRVKSQRGTQFRQWANRVLKKYLLKGYSMNQRFERIEQRLGDHDKKIDFFVRTALPSHDRFLIIDDAVYHIGASLKDLGKKWFAFTKMMLGVRELLEKIV
ncbi:hypothetical protein AGMMS49940_14690 [Spirochaetia bacterium]|nr:hypothetical protein AGMMS49940_14690 [Spirochaetia bacterium]